MESIQFIKELYELQQQMLAGLDNLELVEAESENNLEMANLLKIALKNEIEASELAAYWISSTREIDVKLGFARQAGDEAKHYRLIEKRLAEMGVDLSGFDPLSTGYSKLFQYLKSVDDTVSRLACGQFMREGIAVKRNEQFIKLCELRGDQETAKLYREIIQPDEEFHHQLGKTMLEKYATDAESQQAARKAVLKTFTIAEELRGLAEKKLGVSQIPGC
jgi:1,2-phenylacetyl-CoA epoxidase catalytic subunit